MGAGRGKFRLKSSPQQMVFVLPAITKLENSTFSLPGAKKSRRDGGKRFLIWQNA
jgi:hypothetical protein